jgi:hypothetical protein
MGRRLDGFDIELQFDHEGGIKTVSYRDGDGCGHEALFSDPNVKLRDVVDYHLAHYKRSHRMEPSRMCNFVLPHPTEPTEYHCNREPHIGDDHELVARRK